MAKFAAAYVEEMIAELVQVPVVTEPEFGRDISCLEEVDPTFKLVQGDEKLRQEIYRSIRTTAGTMFGDPDYSLDIDDFVHSRLSDVEMGARITARVKRNPNIRACVTEVVKTSSDTLKITVKATPLGTDRQIVLEV